MKREKLDKRSTALLEELEALLANPRAVEIVANDWLHDGKLPMPSLDLIRCLRFRIQDIQRNTGARLNPAIVSLKSFRK